MSRASKLRKNLKALRFHIPAPSKKKKKTVLLDTERDTILKYLDGDEKSKPKTFTKADLDKGMEKIAKVTQSSSLTSGGVLKYDSMAWCGRCKKIQRESQMFSEEVCNLCVTESEKAKHAKKLKDFRREFLIDLKKARRKAKAKAK